MRKIVNPLIDPRTDIFRRGKHEGERIEDVYQYDARYLEWIVDLSYTHPLVKGHIRKIYLRCISKFGRR